MRNYLILSYSFISILLFILFIWIFREWPLFSEESFYHFYYGRYFRDGNTNYWLWPFCGESIAALPSSLLMLPIRYVDAFLYADAQQTYIIRYIGLFSSIYWFSIVTFALHKKWASSVSIILILSGILAVTGLGGLRYLMAFNRPELAILVSSTTIALLPLIFQNYRASYYVQIIFGLTILFLVEYMFGTHQKALFFTPLGVIALIYLIEDKYLKAIFLIILSLIIFSFYKWWVLRYSCPSDQTAFIEYTLKQGINPRIFFSEPRRFLQLSWASIANSIVILYGNLLVEHPWVFWSPEIKLRGAYLDLANYVMLYFFAFCVVFTSYRVSITLIRSQLNHKIIFDRNFVVPSTIFLCLIIFATINIAKHFYENTIFLPLIILCSLLLMPLPKNKFDENFLFFMLAFVSIVSFIGQIAILEGGLQARNTYWKKFMAYDCCNIGVHDISNDMQHIVSVAEKCGISNSNDVRHIGVDEFTALGMQNTFQPINIRWLREVTKDMYPGSTQNFKLMMKMLRSQGAVFRCSELSNELGSLGTDGLQHDDTSTFCCLPDFQN